MLLRRFRLIALPGARPRVGRWATATNMELYDVRVCPYCGHLVSGRHGQQAAKRYHEDLQEQINGPEEWQDPGGFILPDQMPPGMTGARPSDDDEERQL